MIDIFDRETQLDGVENNKAHLFGAINGSRYWGGRYVSFREFPFGPR